MKFLVSGIHSSPFITSSLIYNQILPILPPKYISDQPFFSTPIGTFLVQTARSLQTNLECTLGIFVFKLCKSDDCSLFLNHLPPPASKVFHCFVDKIQNPQSALTSSTKIWFLCSQLSHSSHAALLPVLGRPSDMLKIFFWENHSFSLTHTYTTILPTMHTHGILLLPYNLKLFI